MKNINKITIVGAGVTGIFSVTHLIEKGFLGSDIEIYDMGENPYNRKTNEVMRGFLGAGLYSDGKLVYKHNQIGGCLSKYCGESKADELINEVLNKIKRFHPSPDKISYCDPQKNPKFIQPYFDLRSAPTWHLGTYYLHEMGKIWYDYLIDQGVKFFWNYEIKNINFKTKTITFSNPKNHTTQYNTLIYATGKSGIKTTENIIKGNKIKTEPKSVQVGVRFEAPQKYFQKMLDISYDFKLYKDYPTLSIRSFCTNSNSAYIAEEDTYGMVTYNGHSTGKEEDKNKMVNFGIIMSIQNIKNPFKWSIRLVKKCQIKNKGLFYSPIREISKNSEGNLIRCTKLNRLDLTKYFGKYGIYINEYIKDLNKIFKFNNNYGIYIPEVKFLSNEVQTDYRGLYLKQYPNVYFGGDSLSARGIMVSAAQGIYIAENIIKNKNLHTH